MERKLITSVLSLMISILILCTSISLSAQVYIEGIATAEYDTLQKEMMRLYVDTKNQEASFLADSLSRYYESKVKKNKSKDLLQNYYHTVIMSYSIRARLETVTKNDLKFVYSLEDKITNLFLEDNKIVALYFDVIGNLKNEVERDFKGSVEYIERSIRIRKTHFPEDKIQIAKRLISKGYALTSLRQFDESRQCFEESLDIKLKMETFDTMDVLYSYYPLAVNYYREKRYEESIEIFNTGFELGKNFLPKDHDLYVAFTRALGVLNKELGDTRNALEFALIGLESAKLKGDTSQLTLKKHYTSIAIMYSDLGNLKLANSYTDTAIAILEKNNTKRSLVASYSNKALYSSNINTSISLLKKALAICPEDPICDDAHYNTLLHNLGDSYARKGNVEAGLNHFLKAAKLREADYDQFGQTLPSSYQAIAGIYNHIGQLDLAIYYQQKAVETVKDFRPDTSYYVAVQTSQLGKLHLRKGELNIAEEILLDANTKLERQVGKLNRDMIFNNTHLSELYIKKKKYGLALKYAKSALRSITTTDLSVLERSTTPLLQIAEIHAKSNSLDSAKYTLNKLLEINGFQPFSNDEITKYDIPAHEQWLSYMAFSKSLYLEDRLFGDNQKYVIGKIKTGISLIDKVRSNYFFEKSEQEFQNSSTKFFNWSLKKLSGLHERSGNENLLPLIFECLEKSKSITINRNFIRHEVSKSESVPEEIIEREKSLIVAYENAFQKYENNLSDDSLNTIYVDEMYTLENSKEEFLDSLETEYPDYFSSRYDQQVTGFKTIRSIAVKDKRSFVINHWADSLIYQFVITPKSNNFSILKTENIKSHIENVQNIVSKPSYSQNEIDFNRTKLDFINSSYAIYESLFGGNNYQLTFDLTMISSGNLVQFPFDVLLTEKAEANTSYKAMPFFIKTHAINYLGSATQYVQLSKSNSYKSSREYIGFAPSYSGMKISNDSLDQFRNANNLNPLLYNFEEVSKTNSLFNGVEYIGKEATEEEFRNIDSQLGILHLAMHTTIDDRFPLDSHLNFTIDSTEEDSRLYAHEIAQMNLNHELVVLSACETNIGEEVKGEGILGIARAFQIASCPNLIVSNWLIDDRSASDIMYTFFKGIKADLSPSKSLRNAKLEFLENSSLVKSHPSYWAGFSYYGNPTLETDWKSNPKVLILGGVTLFLLFLIPFLIQRKTDKTLI